MLDQITAAPATPRTPAPAWNRPGPARELTPGPSPGPSHLLGADGRLRFRAALAAAREERAFHRDLLAMADRYPGYAAAARARPARVRVEGFVGAVRQRIDVELMDAERAPPCCAMALERWVIRRAGRAGEA